MFLFSYFMFANPDPATDLDTQTVPDYLLPILGSYFTFWADKQ